MRFKAIHVAKVRWCSSWMPIHRRNAATAINRPMNTGWWSM